MSDDENAEMVHDWESDCYVLHDEITRPRAENEKLREALRPFSWQWDTYGKAHQDDERLVQISVSMRDLRVASSALEGVTEPASPWRDIESAPRDGTKFLAFARSHTDYYGVAQWAEAAPDFQRSVAGWFWAFAIRPTHWMPLPEPPR